VALAMAVRDGFLVGKGVFLYPLAGELRSVRRHHGWPIMQDAKHTSSSRPSLAADSKISAVALAVVYAAGPAADYLGKELVERPVA